MTVASYEKDPDAVLDYGISWASWLAAGETITAAEWSVDPPYDLEDNPGGVVIDEESFTDDTTTVWLSSGAAGSLYRATAHVTTDDGREDDRSLSIYVRER